MKFNNGLERKRFEAKQASLRKGYQKVGMSEEQILAMYELDLAEFNSNRKYVSHMQPISGTDFENDEDSNAETGQNPLFEKFGEALSINLFEEQEHSRFWWVEEIDDIFLSSRLKMLSEVDLELLTLLTFDGYSEKQAASILGISDRTVRRKLASMKLFLKKTPKVSAFCPSRWLPIEGSKTPYRNSSAD